MTRMSWRARAAPATVSHREPSSVRRAFAAVRTRVDLVCSTETPPASGILSCFSSDANAVRCWRSFGNQRIDDLLALRTLHQPRRPDQLGRQVVDQVSLTTRILQNTHFIGPQHVRMGDFRATNAPQRGPNSPAFEDRSAAATGCMRWSGTFTPGVPGFGGSLYAWLECAAPVVLGRGRSCRAVPADRAGRQDGGLRL